VLRKSAGWKIPGNTTSGIPRTVSKTNLPYLRPRRRTNSAHKILREIHHFQPRFASMPDPVISFGSEKRDGREGRRMEVKDTLERPTGMLPTCPRDALLR
jgi:hypothetical protein